MEELPIEVIFDKILSYLCMRDASMCREVCSSWSIYPVVKSKTSPLRMVHHELREACKDINLNGFKERYVSLFEDMLMKMPYLNVDDGWPIYYEYLLATEEETWFIRHILLDYISYDYVIPMLDRGEYLRWYVVLTEGDKDMILRLPPDIRERTGVCTDLDILLYDRMQERLRHPFLIQSRKIIYEFDTLSIQDGDFLLYVGSTAEGLVDTEGFLSWISDDEGAYHNLYPTYVHLYTDVEDMYDYLSSLACGGHYTDIYIGQMKESIIIDVTQEHWEG